MKLLNTKIKKSIATIVSIILIAAVLIILFISPIAKYVLEKYDVNYLGREVKLSWIYVNPFTGYAYISDLEIYEEKSDSVFFSAEGVSANFAMFKLLSNTYEISELTIHKPIGIIAQNKKKLNFDDLIAKFSPKDTLQKKQKDPTHFNILNIKIKDGLFYYFERSIPVNYSVRKVDIETTGIMWNVDTIVLKFALVSGIGSGDIKGEMTMNLASLDYSFDALINKYDLSILEQYMDEISNYGSLQANLDGDIKAKGNFRNSENIDANGLMSINDLHFGKNKVEDYLSFKKFTIDIKQLNPSNKKYLFDSISLTEPYLKFELYDSLDNLQNMFGKDGEKVKEVNGGSGNPNLLFQIADYVKLLAKNFFKSDYKISRLAIYHADLHYVDYTLSERFEIAATPLYIIVDSIEHGNKWVDLTLRTNLKPYGKASVNLSMNPNDSSDFNIEYHLQQLPVTMFNPYLVTYTSFPVDRGTMELKGSWKVNNGVIKSNNHLVVIDPRISDRQKKKDSKWVPLNLIMFFVRERGNVIDYEIPISGNLNNPRFKLNDVILDVLTNLFVKPVTASYRAQVKSIENEIEKSFTVKWEMGENKLQPKQEKFAEELTDYLKKNPEASISVTPILHIEKEKEYLLLFEAKKRYYLTMNDNKRQSLSEKDTMEIVSMSSKDAGFENYLNKNVGKEMLFTVQDKCMKLIGLNKVKSLYEGLVSERKKGFVSYFINKGVGDRVKFKSTLNITPYNGFSLYQLEYNGEWPEDLSKAYFKMIDFNSKRPRNKFSSKREENQKQYIGK